MQKLDPIFFRLFLSLSNFFFSTFYVSIPVNAFSSDETNDEQLDFVLRPMKISWKLSFKH